MNSFCNDDTSVPGSATVEYTLVPGSIAALLNGFISIAVLCMAYMFHPLHM